MEQPFNAGEKGVWKTLSATWKIASMTVKKSHPPPQHLVLHVLKIYISKSSMFTYKIAYILPPLSPNIPDPLPTRIKWLLTKRPESAIWHTDSDITRVESVIVQAY